MRGRTKFFILKTNLLTGAAVIGITAAMPALAQQATQLQPITVQGEAAGGNSEATATSPVKGYVAKRSATGSKSDIPLKDIPQSVSVIGREELQDRGVVNKVDEALRYTSGVTAEPFGVDADTDWFYIRGFNATQSGVFLDGLNLFSYSFGGFQIDPYFLERVEVLKGPASVLYGGASPGGIVNMVSKRPQDEPFVSTEVGINTFGNAFVGFDANQPIDPDGVWKYRITGRVAGGDQFTDFAHDFRGAIAPQVSFEPDAATSLNVYGYFSALDQVHVGGSFLPYYGTVKNASFGKIDRDAFLGEPDIDNGKYNQAMLGYEFKHEFDNGWKLSQNLRFGHLYKHEIGPYTYGYYDPSNQYNYSDVPLTPDNLLGRIGFEGTSNVDTFSVDTRLEREFETGGLDHNFLVGIDYRYYNLDQVQASGGGTPISANNPIYGTPQGAASVYLDQNLTMQQLGIYAQDQIRFGDGWIATLNGRYDFVDKKSESPASLVYSPDYDEQDGAFSGRAGLAYEFGNGLTPYVSAATFFTPVLDANAQPPVGDGSSYDPEKGYQIEAGIKYEPTFIDGVLTASVFQITKKNVLVPFATPVNPFGSASIGEVKSTGIELEGKVNIDEHWKVLSSFTYLDMEITKDRAEWVGNYPMLIPDTTATLWLDYSVIDGPLEGLSFGAGVRYQGQSWADNTNEHRVPGATLFDAGLRYEKEGWGASLNVTNLFDKDYVKGCQGTLTCSYGDPRTITFKLSKKW